MLNEAESQQAVTHLLPYFWPHCIDPEDGGKKRAVSKTLISTQF